MIKSLRKKVFRIKTDSTCHEVVLEWTGELLVLVTIVTADAISSDSLKVLNESIQNQVDFYLVDPIHRQRLSFENEGDVKHLEEEGFWGS